MTWLARLSLANRAVVGLVTVLLLAFGLLATGSLRQELLPSFSVPSVTVVTPYAGASPEVVAEQVTEPIETAVTGVTGLTRTTSSSTGGSSVITLDLQYGTDIDTATGQIERAIRGVTLPEDVTPQVGTMGTDSIPVLQLAVSSDLPPDQLAAALRDRVQPLLGGIDGVGEVTLTGIRDPRITIDVDTAKATERGVSLTAVQSLLQSNGVRVPAGQLAPDTAPITVQAGSPITSVDQFRDLYLTPGASPQPGAAATATPRDPVRLGDIATVTAERAPATGYTRTDGVDSIGIGVIATGDANTVAVSKAVRDALPDVTDAIGGSAQNARATVVFDQAPFIEQSVADLTTEGLLGLLFAVLVILAFLLSVRATLVTAVSIPLSLLIALIVLWVGDYTLNILTLAALTVAVGRVVDDSIVVIENIKRHLGYGEPRRKAIITAVREVAGAITASTMTTVAVFAPIGLVGGQVGELFRPFAVTVAAALLASLLVSLTVVPVLASMVMRGSATSAHAAEKPVEKEPLTVLQRGYLPVLRGALARPVLAIAVAVGILAGTVALVPFLQTSFIGNAGGDTLTVTQDLAPGTALPQADDAAKKVETVLGGTGGVETYTTTVGTTGAVTFGPPGDSGGGVAPTQFSVTLDADADAGSVADDLRSRFTSLGTQDQVGTLTVTAGQNGGSDNVAVDVRADDPAALAEAARQVQDAVAGVNGVSDVQNNLAAAQPVIDVTVDRQKAAEQGLTEAQIGQSVATALRGSTIGTLTVDGVEESVLLRTGAAPADLRALQALTITGSRGDVALSDVATVARTTTAPSIERTDGARSAQITARPVGDDLGAVTATLTTTIDELRLPAGATATIGGVSAEQSDAFAQLGLALMAAIAVVYLVMVVAFRSLLQPLLLLVSIPFAATGALGLLLITGQPLGVAAIIGMMMLVGVVVTNAIVLIDLVNQYRQRGRPLYEAIVEGAAQRLRPILMTATATIFALLPMALGLTGGGAFISQPLAVVVIGGLVSSTLLTLVLLPVLYLLAERGRERRRVAVPDEPVVEEERLNGHRVAAGRPAAAVPAPSDRTSSVQGLLTDQDAVPLPGAVLLVLDTAGAQVGSAVAAADGGFRVALPTAGEYTLVGRMDGQEPAAVRVTVPAGPLRVDIAVEGPASVTGQVRTGGGAGVPAMLTLVSHDGGPAASVRAAMDGSFRFSRVLAGDHHLLVMAPDGRSTTFRVVVPVAGTLRHDVTLPGSREPAHVTG
jgi:hydrophobic/amphiphilic exporter-1 (mainly G- bacteria), HAE1 family